MNAVGRFATFAGASDPLALAQEIDMIIEGALITHQVSPECDVFAIALWI